MLVEFTHLLFTPNFIDGRLSPPPVGPIYDVIVHQAGGVDHLRDHGNGTLPWQQVAAEIKGHMLGNHKKVCVCVSPSQIGQ